GLLQGQIDFAVHSMKDMPTVLPEGLQISSLLKRHNPADVLISEKYNSFAQLPQGAKVGTSSLRRKAQLLHVRPDLDIHDLRGNLQTRMRKMKEEQFDGIILAAAGVERLGWQEQITEELSHEVCLPAVSQGVIGVETRCDDPEIIALVQLVNDAETEQCVLAERALLKSLEGGCQIPIGAYARLEGQNLILEGLVGSLDGSVVIRDQISGPADMAEQLGQNLALRLAAEGGQAILDEIRMELNP
ncbi:MAG: hydroxymethylbilane synthase, partial [Peptococcaceae bacterium]